VTYWHGRSSLVAEEVLRIKRAEAVVLADTTMQA
jgi:hypothetical protein